MQKLHLVGITPELDGLILSTRKGAKSGSFVVSVDSSVLKQLLESGKAPEPPAPRRNGLRGDPSGPRVDRPESQLSPREMQDLLRGGWTLEEVAVEAGVDVDWVSRFAAPVRAEIRRILDQAREMVFDKPRAGPSALRLGPSVRRNVAERGIRFTDEDFEDGWRAWQLDELTWVIEFEYQSRGRQQLAEWALDLDTGELLSRNRLGTQLAHVQSTRRKVSTAPPPKPKPKAAAVRAVTKKAPAQPVPPRPAVVPPARRVATSAPTPAPKRPRTRRPGTRAAATSSSGGKTSKPPAAVAPTAATSTTAPRADPWRDELRRREAERAAATSRPPAPEPPPEPDPAPARPEPRRAPSDDLRPVAVVGPTVRMLSRRPPRPTPAPRPPRPVLEEPAVEAGAGLEVDDGPDDDSWPELAWSIGEDKHGPLPVPGPVAVPDEVREQVASAPLGTAEPPPPVGDPPDDAGAGDTRDAAPGAGHREPRVPPPPARASQPVFRGADPAKAAARPRRREPLRAR